jgi:hypothetical protein
MDDKTFNDMLQGLRRFGLVNVAPLKVRPTPLKVRPTQEQTTPWDFQPWGDAPLPLPLEDVRKAKAGRSPDSLTIELAGHCKAIMDDVSCK